MGIITEILIFLVVIVVLILVHELGHFIVAKICGMRVDEFGIGYPPRALTIAKIGETEYTLNWLPFGGFVRIYGEDGNDEAKKENGSIEGDTLPKRRSFTAKPRILQALTLIAGIAMNWIFAFILITITLVIGTPQPISAQQVPLATNVYLAVDSVNPGSPAVKDGFQEGDEIKNSTILNSTLRISYNGTNPSALSTLIASDASSSPMAFVIERNGKTITITAAPVKGAVVGDPSRVGFGFALASVGTIKTAIGKAPLQGLELTWNATERTAQGLWTLLKGLVTFSANLSQVAGPVGIAGAIGQASAQGLSALLSLSALISINLAIVNLIPIPALDGGRLLFVIIESITRKPIPSRISERVNAIGFALLILLMVIITGHDIWNLF